MSEGHTNRRASRRQPVRGVGKLVASSVLGGLLISSTACSDEAAKSAGPSAAQQPSTNANGSAGLAKSVAQSGARAAQADVHDRGQKGQYGIARKRVNRVPDGIPGKYIVVLEEGVARLGAYASKAVSNQLISKRAFKRGHVYEHVLRGFSAEMSEAEAAEVAKDADVAYVVEDSLSYASLTQNNPPWGLDRIDQRNSPVDAVYTTSRTGAGVNVYVLDTGILPTHNELAGRASVAFDAIDDGQNGIDCHGHGTHVAGTVAGTTYGVAKSAKVYGVRVLGCGGSGANSGILAALDWVAANAKKPAVVNMSLGGSPSPEIDQAVRNVITAGVSVVVAAGNSNTFAEDESPARVSEAITVGATDVFDNRAAFSNFGRVVDIFAPGVDVSSAWYERTDAAVGLSGTSMASPHVAGAVALYLETSPNATPAQVEAAIVSSGTLGKVKDPGPGAVNRLLFSSFTAPTARTALFVVGNTTLSASDTALRARLQSSGYTVTLRSGSVLVAADATGQAVVVISASVDPATVNSKLTNAATPVVSLEGLLFDDLKLTGTVQGTDYGQVTTPDTLFVADDRATLAAGLRGSFDGSSWDHLVQVSTSGGRFWGLPSANAVGLAGKPVTLNGQPNRATVFGYEPGAAMVGLNAPARRVGLFADEAAVASFTAQGWALFDQAVDWASGALLSGVNVTYGPTLAVSSGSVALNWASSKTNVRHDILRAARPGGPYTKLTTLNTPGIPDSYLGALYSYTDTTAVNGQTYYYVITPTEPSGPPGRATRALEAYLGTPEAAWHRVYYITDQTGALQNIEVNFDSDNCTNLRLFRSDSANGPFTLVATKPHNPGTGAVYDDPTAVANHQYFYQVQPYNAFGNGPTSAPFAAYFEPDGAGVSVQNLQASPLPAGARVTWNSLANATSYEVQVIRSDGQLIWNKVVTEPDATVPLEPGQFFNINVFPIGSFALANFSTVSAQSVQGTALVVVGQTAPLRQGDQQLVWKLQSLGYTVTPRRSADLVTADANGKTLVVVSSTAVPSEVGTKLTTVPVPVVDFEPFVLGQLQMTGATAGQHFGVFGSQTSLVVDSTDELAAGSPRTTVFTAKPGNYGWGIPVASAQKVARLPGSKPLTGTAPSAEFAYEKGAILANGSAAAARRVALLLDTDSLGSLTTDGSLLLESAIRWAVDPAAADPATPTSLAASVSGSNVTLTWPAAARATSYVVYRAQLSYTTALTPLELSKVVAQNVTGTTFVDTARPAGSEHIYFVAGINASGGGARSPGVFVGVNARPRQPSISTAALDGAVRIAIQGAGNVQSYRVLKATTSGGPYTTIASNLPANTTQYTATGLTNGVPAYFTVEAVNPVGAIRSLEAYGIPRPALTAPAGLWATAQSGTLNINWNAVPNARGYRVTRSLNTVSTPTDFVAETTFNTLTDVNLPNNQGYTWYITALGDAELTGPTSTFNSASRGVALFVRAATPTAGDIVLRDRLTALGFDVIEKSDSALVTADANGRDIVVVSESVTSGNVNTKLTNVAAPVLTMEPSILDDLRMTSNAGTDYGTTGNQTQINVVDVTHPLAALLSGVRTVNSTGGTYLRGIPGGDASIVGRLTAAGTPAGIFGYEPGTLMSGLIAPGRRVGLFVDSIAATSFTADGRTLFDAAVTWTAGLR